MRTFLAINLSQAVKEHLWQFSVKLQKIYARQNIAWVRQENFHITVEFLGELGAEEVKIAKAAVGKIIDKFKGREIVIELNQYTALPAEKNPRALVVGGKSSSSFKAYDLIKNIHDALTNKGFELDNKKWTSHVTLGRVKDWGARLKFDGLEFTPVNVKEESVDLMKSELRPEGSVYTKLNSYPL